MIVKNESSAITHCLDSVKALIDYWVIVDTGSTDGTQSAIMECLKGIPGDLYERPWVDFAHNRNEALDLARGRTDYTLFMDADERLIFSPNFMMPSLDQDIYSIYVKTKAGIDAEKWFLVDNRLDWRWVGVLHETITCENIQSKEIIQGVINYSDTALGVRSQDPQKYLRDAEILQKELEKDPAHCRYQFYLASSYLDAKEFYLALEHFEKRAAMGGHQGEVFLSLFGMARLQEKLSMSPEIFISNYLKAHACCSYRAEALFYLGGHYLDTGQYELAYETFVRTPTDRDFIPFCIESAVYDWKVFYFLAKTCWHLKKNREMKNALEKVLLGKNVPTDVLEEARKNLSILKTQYLEV